MSDEISMDGPVGGGLSVVDASRMTLVLLIDSDGRITLRAGLGHSHRQIANALHVLAGDLDDVADERGEPVLTDAERFTSWRASRGS